MTQFPLIHLNGSHGPTLRDQYLDAVRAVNKAVEALHRIDVHNRDYYVIGSRAGAEAMHEHRTRILKLQSVKKDLEEIATDIDRQIDKREQRRA